jgi:hypothetical protein
LVIFSRRFGRRRPPAKPEGAAAGPKLMTKPKSRTHGGRRPPLTEYRRFSPIRAVGSRSPVFGSVSDKVCLMPIILHDFLYLDDRIVQQFLEQLEGGAYDEERQVSKEGKDGGVSGGAKWGPANLDAKRTRTSGEERERKVRPTPHSRFASLSATLQEYDGVQTLISTDEEIWDQIAVSEMVEATVTLDVPAIFGTLAQLDTLGEFEAMAKNAAALTTIFDLPEDSVRGLNEAFEQLDAAAPIASHLKNADVPCRMKLVGSPKYELFGYLRRDALKADISDLEGEAKVLARVQQRVEKGSPYRIPIGLPKGFKPNRAQRRASTGQNSQEIRLQYPAMVVRPVAIYR